MPDPPVTDTETEVAEMNTTGGTRTMMATGPRSTEQAYLREYPIESTRMASESCMPPTWLFSKNRDDWEGWCAGGGTWIHVGRRRQEGEGCTCTTPPQGILRVPDLNIPDFSSVDVRKQQVIPPEYFPPLWGVALVQTRSPGAGNDRTGAGGRGGGYDFTGLSRQFPRGFVGFSTIAVGKKCTHATPLSDQQEYTPGSRSQYVPAGIRGLARGCEIMPGFRVRPGSRSTSWKLPGGFSDIAAFDAVVRSLVLKNPLGCTSYMGQRKNHPPVEIVREMYTARFAYRDAGGKRIGRGSETYDSVEGFQNGIAAVISNMANIAAHRGKVRHLPEEDLFSVLVKCHDPGGELYFLSLSRRKVVLSSYTGEAVRRNVVRWLGTLPSAA